MASRAREWRFMWRHPAVRAGALVCAALLAANAGYAGLGWWPARSEATRASAERDTLRRELAAALRAQELAGAYDAAVKTVAAVEQRLAAESGQAELVQQVNAMARASGVEILGEANEVGRGQGGYLPLHQSLSLRGRYAELRAFLASLSELPTWTLVREVRLERERAGERLHAQIVLVTFRPERITTEAHQ